LSQHRPQNRPDDDAGRHVEVPAVTQARLAAIIEFSDDAIVSKDLNGIVTSWNRGAELIFGWSAAEIIGRPITMIIPPERKDEEPEILRRLRAGERVDHFETERVTKDGRRIDVSVTISPIRDADGRIVGASKIARDITLQKQFEHDLRVARDIAERAREAAEIANRAKDHFLSVLSHELRTPLTPVLAAIDLMEHDPALPPQLVEQVGMIRRNVETEARLVDDLLDLTRMTRGMVRLHFEVVDAHAVVRDVVTMFSREIDEKGLTVTTSLRARSSHVWADPGRFQQVLLNLVSNAVKFTPQDGTITIRTSSENGSIKIEVIDTGIGITADVMPRLFRPFEQGEEGITRQFGGLGRGLSVVKSLVDLHKGSVSVTSDGRNKGTAFILRFDTVTPRLSGESAKLPTGQGQLGQPVRRVLLVEDHADTRAVMTRLLASLGCEVTAAASVSEAIAAADRQTFDLLVSDIGLPDGSGIDVMRHVRSHHRLVGIALSGFGQDDDIRRSRDAGFATHLTKPVNVETLHEAIRKVTTAE
jgi:PAS domain S-box-containing protein